jgi:Uma2 family endonuclease
MLPTGDNPGYVGDEIFVLLREYAKRTKIGRAFANNKGFRVNLPHRESFSPDAVYHTGPRTSMRFLEGAPVFEMEVRRQEDYGPAVERAMAQKRADYFACGTLVVWDVDLLSPDVVKSYQVSEPESPVIFRRGDIADVEPAVPGLCPVTAGGCRSTWPLSSWWSASRRDLWLLDHCGDIAAFASCNLRRMTC